MIKPGKITVTSYGTMQGVFRPTMRAYYHNERHGILFEEITKPIRCRSRKRAVELGKVWRKSPEGVEVLRKIFDLIASRAGNTIPAFVS